MLVIMIELKKLLKENYNTIDLHAVVCPMGQRFCTMHIIRSYQLQQSTHYMHAHSYRKNRIVLTAKTFAMVVVLQNSEIWFVLARNY